VPDGRFRLEARFKNLNQGEFYLYNLEQGRKDTLKANEGRFIYETSMQDTTTLMLMFPNFSEMPIFAQPGARVRIDGDVSHLKETEISGTQENEEMTRFRMETNELMPPEVIEKAEQFILNHPQSVVSIYLLRRYFIQGLQPDYPRAAQLCATLFEAQPNSIVLGQLSPQLNRLKNLRESGSLPSFKTVDTNKNTIDNSMLTSKVNVILVWATWSYDSQYMLRQMLKLKKQHSWDLNVISISLDASPDEGRKNLERDSITWPNICDGKLWQSPLVAKLGITSVPDNIVTDKDGNIICRNLKPEDLYSKIESLLK
jgi:hypothetical protein